MSAGFEAEDLDSIFDTDGHGVKVLITGASFSLEVNGVFGLTSQDVPIYGETGVDAEDPVLECKSTDLVDVKRGMNLTMPELEAHEDGFGKNYQICRLVTGQQSTRMLLKEI